MPVAKFRLPDGRIARFNVPEGTTPEQAQQMIAQQIQQDPNILEAPPSDPGRVESERRQQPDAAAPQDGAFQQAGQAVDRAGQAITSTGAGRGAAEFAAAFNRGVTQLADFLTTDQINAVAQILGPEMLGVTESQLSVPSITEILSPATQGGFMEEGLARDVVRGAGEVIPAAVGTGAAVSRSAAQLPRIASGSEGTAAGALRQIGRPAPVSDVALGGASGAGAAVGEEAGGAPGAAVGAIAAPLSAAGAGQLLRSTLSAGARGIQGLMRSLDDMSEEGASTLLAEAMVREGLSPDQVAARMRELGPEAIPADVGNNFSRLLRTAANKVPSIEGESGRVLSERQLGQGERIAQAFDDAAGVPKLNVDDEIVRIDNELRPQIDSLYSAARNKSEQVFGGPRPTEGYSFGSPHLAPKKTKLQQLLDGENIGGPAQAQAHRELNAKRLSGEKVTSLDLIDATKRAIDDQVTSGIREDKMAKARSFLKLKNALVSEADKAIPEYAEARSLFAGKASLENAADMGQEFFKLKPRDVDSAVQSMGESEKRMFRLGAKQALIDKLDTMQVSRDAVKGLFGRRGDVQKLKAVFDTEEQFKNFSDTLEREANFILTRRAAQANSTTAKQIFDERASSEALENARAVFGDPIAAASTIGRIMNGLRSSKASQANTRALELAGDILLERGMNPEKIALLLRKASADQVAKELRRVAPKRGAAAEAAAPTTGAVGAFEPQPGDNRQRQQEQAR